MWTSYVRELYCSKGQFGFLLESYFFLINTNLSFVVASENVCAAAILCLAFLTAPNCKNIFAFPDG